MSLLKFVRCQACGMPHEASAARCPTTGAVLTAVARLREREARMAALEGRLIEGKYRVQERIGEGGMSVVYRAENRRLGTAVALKVLHDSLQEDTAARRRFEREGFVGGALSHPNLVRMFDGGVLPDGRPFLVMELLKGEPLSDRLRREVSLPIEDAIFVAEHVLRGLAATHEQGIVHRDVNPDNIFVRSRLEGIDAVKLIDFSVSKFLESATQVSVDGEVLGTAAYLAPEQATGQRDLDHRVDIWALGVVLYQMLVGSPPFRAETLIETVTAVLHDAPAPPSRIRPDIYPSLDALVLRALAKDRADRWPSAMAMIGQLRDAGRSDTLRPPELLLDTLEEPVTAIGEDVDSLDETLPR